MILSKQKFNYSDDEYSFDEVSKKIGRMLIAEEKLSKQQLDNALNIQQRSTNKKAIGSILIEQGYISDDDFSHALARQLGIKFIAPDDISIDQKVLDLIPVDYAREHTLIPMGMDGKKLMVLMRSPNDLQALQMLHFMTGNVIDPYITTTKAINTLISETYIYKEDEDILQALNDDTDQAQLTEEKALKLAKDKPTVRLVNHLLIEAIQRNASDLHIRPQENCIELIFRIDGQLDLIRNFPKSVLAAIISRFKVLGKMDISERRLPQDGRFQVKNDKQIFDMRISIMPTIYGESLVIRLLDSSEKATSLEHLGLSDSDAETFKDLLNRNMGLILVTGPTGSGKSTTLYAALQKVRERNINIITVEDPVEYRMKGITQIQVKTKIGYTFERALKNILRHDPDAIMIGEMRDFETTKIGVESALTGHLVLSTLHTNDAASTITRLLEMGIADYLIRSTLLAVFAQRLVRKNCPHCLVEEFPDELQARALNISTDEKFYKGLGCKLCHNTGYSGRIVVYELMTLNAELRNNIKASVSSDILETIAIRNGMKTLPQQALFNAQKKLINLSQVLLTRKI